MTTRSASSRSPIGTGREGFSHVAISMLVPAGRSPPAGSSSANTEMPRYSPSASLTSRNRMMRGGSFSTSKVSVSCFHSTLTSSWMTSRVSDRSRYRTAVTPGVIRPMSW